MNSEKIENYSLVQFTCTVMVRNFICYYGGKNYNIRVYTCTKTAKFGSGPVRPRRGLFYFFSAHRRSKHIGINNNINSNVFHACNFRSERETLLMVKTPCNSVRIRHKHYAKVYIIIIICVADFGKFGGFFLFFFFLLYVVVVAVSLLCPTLIRHVL